MNIKSQDEINFKYNLKAYWEILRPYKLLIFLVIFLTIVMEVVSVSTPYLFKLIVDNGTEFFAGNISKAILVKALLMIALVYAGIQIVGIVSDFIRHRKINKLETTTIFDLKKKYFNHILGLSHSFYTTHKTGSLISRLTRGGSAIERMTDVFVFNWIPLFFELVLVVGSLLYFDAVLALITFSVFLVFVVFSFIMQRIQEPDSLKSNRCEDIEKANIADIFTNIDSIKYFGKENYIKKKFSNLSNKTREAFLKNWNYYCISGAGQMLILSVGTFLLIYFSVKSFLAGSMELGTLVFVYTVYGRIIGPMYGFVHGIKNFYRAMADFQDLFEYGKVESQIKDKPDAKECKISEGNIEFKNMDFNYGKRKIFENFNLKIHKNQKIALVGHSGSGKTTLVKLLYRLYDVNSGGILIDGKDIRDFKHESLRSEMSIVPQECVLFDDTVFNNILFSRPDATRKEVMDAIRFAQLDKIVAKFPKKEQTIVGERGVKLSGGEKQRVSLARAILANKQVLVLDEATSSLDSQTEHDIQDDLKNLMKGRTSIVIAHRLSTIMTADKIVVMKDGKIVQMGNHKELIRQRGEYRKLWELQKGGYIK